MTLVAPAVRPGLVSKSNSTIRGSVDILKLNHLSINVPNIVLGPGNISSYILVVKKKFNHLFSGKFTAKFPIRKQLCNKIAMVLLDVL